MHTLPFLFSLFVHRTGCLEDMGVDFEIRDERGWLIGHSSTFYGWDGEKPCGWGHDPCIKAAEACRMAREALARRPRPVLSIDTCSLWELVHVPS